MAALKKIVPNLEFHGIGGINMQLAGIRSVVPINHLSVMGFIEIIPHIFRIRKYIKHTIKKIEEYKPDLIITIDSPGFNFRIVDALKKQNFNTKYLHIVAPSVWAYAPERAEKIAKLYDMLLTLLPFEPPLFKKYGLPTEFIGHPIFEQNFNRNTKAFRKKYNIPEDSEIICVTPGSRNGEIKRHMKVFVDSLKLLKTKIKIFVLFPLARKEDELLVKSYVKNAFPHVCIFDEERIDAYAISDAALAKSGTNTLEILACETPLVVGYKVNFFTYLYIKHKILIKYISLVNILSNKDIVPEFIQDDCTGAKLANALAKYIANDKLAEIQVREAEEVMREIGFNQKSKPSEKAAEIIAKKFLRGL
ncbi:MAG UNVERIFIED_CONTAM: lipid-A-disaccharide synthase [Rickettsiaceae bacterium]|jgi:lipid-A-disaccharide synthase